MRISQEVANFEDRKPMPQNEKATQDFFNEIIRFNETNEGKKIAIIVVSHAVYDLRLFLKVMEKIGRIYIIIFKSSHPNIQIQEEITRAYPEALKHDITKEKLKEDVTTIHKIVKGVSEEEKILIIDIGGYFAPCIPIISKSQSLTQKIIGIVEDTENGHQKYQKYIAKATIPIASVARCKLKSTEDYNVGKSIVDTADMLLKKIKLHTDQLRTQEMTCGVIGFGKIGSSIGEHLREKRVKKLLIYDQDPLVLMRAASLNFRAATKEDILKKCNMIYSATGQKSLTLKDLEEFESEEVYIASCTSADDEFACNVKKFDTEIFDSDKVGPVETSVYITRKGKRITFLANGNAVNFYLQANALGNYIRGVQGAILLSSLKLISKTNQLTNDFNELSHSEEKVISKLWLKYFYDINDHYMNAFLMQSSDKQKFIRDQDIRLIEHKLRTKGYCCVFGENGTGKTEITRKIAQTNKDYYELIWYIDETNEGKAYKEMAKKLNKTFVGKGKEELLRELFSSLIGKNNFLIIFDKATDDEQIKKIIEIYKMALASKQDQTNSPVRSDLRAHMIFITLEQPKIDADQSHEIKPLSEDDMRLLLPEFNMEMQKLSKLTRGYPFLVDKVLSYLKYANIDLGSYYQKVQAKIGVGGVADIDLSSFDLIKLQKILIEISAEKIMEWKENGQMLAFQLILFCTLLDGKYIQPEISNYFFSKILNNDDTSTIQYARGLVEKYGLLEVWKKNSKDGSNPYYMRKLTQDIIFNIYLNNDNLLQHFFVALRVINQFFQYKPYQKEHDLEKCYEYIPHAHAIINNLIRHTLKENLYQTLTLDQLLELLKFLYQLASIHLYEYRDYEKSFFYFHEIKEIIKLWLANNTQTFNAEIERFDKLATNGEIINLSRSLKKEKRQSEHLKKLLAKLNSINLNASSVDLDDKLLQAEVLINQSYIEKYLASCFIQAKCYFEGIEFLKKSRATLVKVKNELNDNSRRYEGNGASPKTLALAHHALGSLYLVFIKHRDLIISNNHELKDEDFADYAKTELESAIKLRSEILEGSNPDLARSRYKYSEVLWEKYNISQNASDSEGKEILLEALRNCKLAISAQEKSLSGEHVNLQFSKDLKRNIKDKLKINSPGFAEGLTSPWTPSGDKTASFSSRPEHLRKGFEALFGESAAPHGEKHSLEQNPNDTEEGGAKKKQKHNGESDAGETKMEIDTLEHSSRPRF